MNFVFFIRSYNDLDCLTPLAHALQEMAPSCCIFLVNKTVEKDFSDDFRVVYLRLRGRLEMLNIADCGPWKYVLAARRLFLRLAAGNRILGSVYYRTVEKLLSVLGSFAERHFEISCLHLCPDSPTVFLFDQSQSTVVEKALLFASEHSIPTVCFQHGAMPPTSETLLSYLSSQGYQTAGEEAAKADIVMVNNENTAKSMPAVPWDKFRMPGSLRFCPQWSAVLDRITPRIELPECGDRLHVLVILSKWKDVIEKEEDLANIRRLGSRLNTFVTVKPHTRGMLVEELENEGNIFVATPEHHTRRLMQAADLVLFTLSSVFLDGLLLDKPMLHFRYTHNWELGCKDIVAGWNIDSSEQLLAWVERFENNKKLRTYSRTEREACLEYYGSRNTDVLGKACQEILSLVE